MSNSPHLSVLDAPQFTKASLTRGGDGLTSRTRLAAIRSEVTIHHIQVENRRPLQCCTGGHAHGPGAGPGTLRYSRVALPISSTAVSNDVTRSSSRHAAKRNSHV